MLDALTDDPRMVILYCFCFLVLPLRVLHQLELCKVPITVPDVVAALADCQFGFVNPVHRGLRLFVELLLEFLVC